jgi:hypothetical protein
VTPGENGYALCDRPTDRPTDRPRWLPADLCRALAPIAAREHLTVRDLVITVVEEFVAYYHAPQSSRPRVSAVRPPAEELETVWRPHRTAPSLIGDRATKSRGARLSDTHG